jgi:hypothetical protein
MYRWNAIYHWKALDKGYNFALKFTSIRGLHKMGFQNHKNPNFENFGIPNLGFPKQNDIWVHALWLSTKNTIRGKVVASSNSEMW